MEPGEEILPQRMTELSEGRIVQYVLESGRSKGQYRPAIVVRNWQQPNGLVNLQVFTDGHNDEFRESVAALVNGEKAMGVTFSANCLWRTSIHYSEENEPGSWHWIEGTSR